MSHELVIEAGRAERQYWKDLWRYRELFLILTWRDVAVQYKQTVVGILWAVLRPLLTMAAFLSSSSSTTSSSLNFCNAIFTIDTAPSTIFSLAEMMAEACWRRSITAAISGA